LKVETKHVEGLLADLSDRNAVEAEASQRLTNPRLASAQAGSTFIIQLPMYQT